ncbi:hypothetical protein E2C01_015238 [Portunus trituberculatus]|uniref:Uncharacterized protein n=1 Tax=Portunus trituberculatus TaxID=210409 RepID=A0A5B7DL98_PORTR|nr:hypothetical protein [Portunus trituberculatus]
MSRASESLRVLLCSSADRGVSKDLQSTMDCTPFHTSQGEGVSVAAVLVWKAEASGRFDGQRNYYA